MIARRARREWDATEMIPGGRNGRRSVTSRRRPAETRILEPVTEPDTARQIGAALDRSTKPGAAFPLADDAPASGARPQHGQEPLRQALEAGMDAARLPRFTAAPARPASRPAPSGKGPVRIAGELPAFAAVAAEMTLPSLLWCAECGRDFTDDETAKYDRMLQFLHIRAAETGWRRDAHGLLRCPPCQQSQWMAAWCLPVLAGGIRAEVALREAVEGPLPESRRAFMPAPEITFDGLPAEAVEVTCDEEGARIKVDWKSVIARPKRAAASQGGRHRKRPAPAMPALSHYDRDSLSSKLRDGAA